MQKIKAKASSLPIFNGRVSDSSTSSTSSSIIMATKNNKKRATFNGYMKPTTVFSISNTASSFVENHEETVDSAEADVVIVSKTGSNNNNSTSKAMETAGTELSNYDKLKVVGQGSFGIAVLYRHKSDNQYVVFKQINLNDLTPSERDLAMNEVEVFSKLHHPNIIR